MSDTPSNTTPTTTPCTPEPYLDLDSANYLIQTNDVPHDPIDCVCGCLEDCYCLLHNKLQQRRRQQIEEMKFMWLAGEKYDYLTSLPSWCESLFQNIVFDQNDNYDQLYPCKKVQARQIRGFFNSSEWNMYYSIYHTYQDELLELLPINVRMMPRFCGNGALLVLLSTWSKCLKNLLSMILDGEFEKGGKFESPDFELFQEIDKVSWEWKMSFTSLPNSSVPMTFLNTNNQKEEIRIMATRLWCTEHVCFLKIIDAQNPYKTASLVPFTGPSGYAVYVTSQRTRDYQELKFASLIERVRMTRRALRAVGYDFISRKDIDEKDLFKFRIGLQSIRKVLVPYCSRRQGQVFDYLRSKDKMILPEELDQRRLIEADEDLCACDNLCVSNLFVNRERAPSCWNIEKASIAQRCQLENRFKVMKRAPPAHQDDDDEEPPRKMFKN